MKFYDPLEDLKVLYASDKEMLDEDAKREGRDNGIECGDTMVSAKVCTSLLS